MCANTNAVSNADFAILRSLMESKLRSGTTLIVDRYSFSGVAFSSAKGLDVEWCKVKLFTYTFTLTRLGMGLIMHHLSHWLQAPDAGLLTPDLVIYLDISPEVHYALCTLCLIRYSIATDLDCSLHVQNIINSIILYD